MTRKQIASFKASATIDRGDCDVGYSTATMVGGGKVESEILLEARYQ